METTISIIVPVYNTALYLQKCIQSIINQPFCDFELLLIDDGSEDSSGSICEYYSDIDDRIKVLHLVNKGVSHARNVGLDHATGKYITFIDSDDYVNQNWLEVLFATITNNEADLAYANYDRIDASGIISRSSFQNNKVNMLLPEERIQYILKTLSSNIGWELWNRIFKKDIIVENSIRFCEECSDYAEDMGFVLSYILCCKTVCSTANNGYHYIIRNNSIMRRNADEIRLDSMNEISKTVHYQLTKSDCNILEKRMYPLIHFAIMFTQYKKLFSNSKVNSLKTEIEKIKDQKYYIANTKSLFQAYSELSKVVGKKDAQRILLFTSYCLHGNYKIYSYTSAIYYRLFWK